MAAPLLAGKALLTGGKWAYNAWRENRQARQQGAPSMKKEKAPLFKEGFWKNTAEKAGGLFKGKNFGYTSEGGVTITGGSSPKASPGGIAPADNTMLYIGLAVAALLMLKK